METIAQERDLSLTKPSGLSGDTKPYPKKIHHWTPDEFEQFLKDKSFPGCTFKDRMRSHLRTIYEKLAEGEWIPQEVIKAVPEAQDEANTILGAERALKNLNRLYETQRAHFQKKAPLERIQEETQKEIDKGKNGHFCYVIGHGSEKDYERPLAIEIEFPNPLGGTIWWVRYFTRYQEFRVYRNRAQANSNIDPFHTFKVLKWT